MNHSCLHHIYGYVEERILMGLNDSKEITPCVIFGVTSIPSRCLHFSIMCESGAQWARIPLHMLRHTTPTRDPHPLQTLQAWDCMGWDFRVVRYEYLREMGCEVLVGDTRIPATYWFTVDHTDNGYSLDPQQHKCYHLLLLQDGSGQIAAMPNNRILWQDHSFVKQGELPRYRTMAPVTWHAEGGKSQQGLAMTQDRQSCVEN
jgi:hypothetical protein